MNAIQCKYTLILNNCLTLNNNYKNNNIINVPNIEYLYLII